VSKSPFPCKTNRLMLYIGSPKPLIKNQVKRLIILLISILLLSSPVIGQSKDDCYLFINGDIGEDKSVIEQIVKPLLSSFISPLKETPIAGLSQSEYNSSCYYEVTVTSTDGTLTLSINATRTIILFNGLSKSSRSFPENIRHSTLRILHSELDNPQKNEICSKYKEILVDECPQNQNLMVVFSKYSDRNKENLMKEPRSNLVSVVVSLVDTMDSVEFIGISEIDIGNDFKDSLKRTMDKKGANSSLVLTTEWDFQKQETSMWKGFVSMTLLMDSYSFKDGGLIKVGSYSVEPQRIPIRKWGKSNSFKKKHLQRITKKITQKWSETDIIDFIQSKN